MACAGGCSREPEFLPVYPARGKIEYKGRPVAGATVILCPIDAASLKDRHPTGTTGPDGTFVLSTYYSRDGGPAGEYKVCVTKEKIIRNKDGEEEGTGKNLLPMQYANPETTPLKTQIVPGDNDLGTFTLNP